MLIDFNDIKEMEIENLNGGKGITSAKMYMEKEGKIMLSKLAKDSSIGVHTHTTSSEINYVISETGYRYVTGKRRDSAQEPVNTAKRDLHTAL